VEFLPQGRFDQAHSRGIPARARQRAIRRAWRRVAILASAATLASLALPAATGSADSAGTPVGLQATVNAANQLSNEIDILGQQYDALRIQLTEARAEAKIAHETALRDERSLGAGQAAVAEIAAEGFMQDGLSPTLQLFQSSDPQEFLDRASILIQLGHEQGGTVSLLDEAEAAANRATQTADQEASQADALVAAMNNKVSQIQAKENILNSSAFAQALAIYDRTGSYPNIAVTGDSLGEQALRWALSVLGVEYVWGGASPQEGFDCSGLVMWAYAHVGISLMHFTGDQWNEGVHVPTGQLKPGDLLFFYNLGHVGLYLDGNWMVDAPTFGQVVQVQQIPWGAFDGAVEII
jgi:peptidoglycan DL-endopeptidase CwlO